MEDILERAGISAMHEVDFAAFVELPPKNAREYSFRMTSGTSGAPLFIVRSSRYHSNDLLRGERILVNPSNNVNLGNVLCVRTAQSRARKVCAISHAEFAHDTSVLDDFAPDCAYGTPSFMTRFLESCSKRLRDGITRAALNGEAVTPEVESHVRQLLPNASIESVYIASETGAISAPPCGHLARGRYHPKKDVTVEVFEPDEHGVGDLLVSVQFSDTRFISRYRIGDIGRIVEERCACGAEKTFEIVGRRGYDYVKAGGVLFHRAEFDRIAAECKDLFDDYRADIYKEGEGARVELRVYRAKGALSPEEQASVREHFSKLFVTATKTLGELFERGFSLVVRSETAPFKTEVKDVKITYRV